MKRYAFLFLATFFALSGIYGSGVYLKGSVMDVNFLVAKAQSVDNSVVCAGKIECARNRDVCAETACLVDEICVGVGDKVQAGDTLMWLEEAQVKSVSAPANSSNLKIPDIDYTKVYSNAEIERLYSEFVKENSAKEAAKSEYVSTGKKTKITAPISGIVSAINANENDLVDKNKSLALVADSEKLRVNVAIEESQVSQIAVGQSVIITGAGFKDSEYTGRVVGISNEAEQVISPTGRETVVNAVVELDSTGDDIKPGFTAKCRIITSCDENKITLPYDVVHADEAGEEFVYLYKDGCAVKTYVTTGKEYSQGFEILEGVSAGDKVITDPELTGERLRVRLRGQNVGSEEC